MLVVGGYGKFLDAKVNAHYGTSFLKRVNLNICTAQGHKVFATWTL